MRPLRPLASRLDPAGPPATATPVRRVGRRRSALRRRSVMVRALRVLAPLGIATIAVVLVGWIVGRNHRRDRSTASAAPITIHMSNPRFLGQDSKGRPYVLVGTDAARDERDVHLVHLTQPRLTLDSSSGKTFVVVGRTGVYNDETHRLALSGDVVVDDARGDRFYSDAGVIDTDSGDVTGRDAARATGPSGTISGDSYALSDKGDHSTFTGRVKSLWTVKPSAAPAGAPAAQPTRP